MSKLSRDTRKPGNPLVVQIAQRAALAVTGAHSPRDRRAHGTRRGTAA
jgi:hypothetical protein